MTEDQGSQLLTAVSDLAARVGALGQECGLLWIYAQVVTWLLLALVFFAALRRR